MAVGIDANTAIQGAINRWAAQGKEHVLSLVKQFRYGLNVDTGNLRARTQAGTNPDGFWIGTNVVYGAAWELGFTRKEYTVRPVNAKALRFNVGGQTVFAQSATIPAQTFAARPWIKPAFDEAEPFLVNLGNVEFSKAFNLATPSRIIPI